MKTTGIIPVSLDEYEDISLLGVRVSTEKNGSGIVVWQEANKIRVRFASEEKTYILDKKYPARSIFEEDEKTVSAFPQFARNKEKLVELRKQLKVLESEL